MQIMNKMEAYLSAKQGARSGLFIPNEEVRKVENLTFPTLPLSEKVKRESTDQGRSAFSLIQSSFSKLF